MQDTNLNTPQWQIKSLFSLENLQSFYNYQTCEDTISHLKKWKEILLHYSFQLQKINIPEALI